MRRLISGTENNKRKALLQRRLQALTRRRYGAKKRAAILKNKQHYTRRLAHKFNRIFHYKRRKEAGTTRQTHFWNNARGERMKKNYRKALNKMN